MSLTLVVFSLLGTVFSLIFGSLIYRQVSSSKWIDSRSVFVFWIFIALILFLVSALWILYFFFIDA